MTDLRKAAENLVKAFEYDYTEPTKWKAIKALRQALAQPDEVLAEREACAKVCEEIAKEFPFEPHEPDPVLPAYCAEAIRARSEK